jgi:hypothetical protein
VRYNSVLPWLIAAVLGLVIFLLVVAFYSFF